MNKTLEKQLKSAKQASYELQSLPTAKKNSVLKTLATLLTNNKASILRANAQDFARLPASYPLADRLRLTDERIADSATGLRAVSQLKDPIGQLLERSKQPTGIITSRVRVPIGVLGIIYEARPNVTLEIFSLCIKTGNAVVLKGGRDAQQTNLVLLKYIRQSLQHHHVNSQMIQMIDPFKRALTTQFLAADNYIDMIIPRGSASLIQYVRKNSSIPTVETGAGVCHTYVEHTANIQKAVKIIINAKTRRPAVCNALDTLVIDQSINSSLLQQLAKPLSDHKVTIYADSQSYKSLRKHYPIKLLKHALPRHYGKEFLGLSMSIKTVESFDEAITFIQHYTSGHSEAIITSNQIKANMFTQNIDAGAVYVNTSTAFTDGFEFGLGAEIGISTQKMHARGPMGLEALTTYKWVVSSNGKIRNP